MNPENPALPASVLVVCLCAEWCGVCRDYRSRFEQVQSRFPQAQFLWIDVEDEADLLDPLDVDDFPTLLLAVGGEPRFFGPLTPQAETLERLIRAQSENLTAPALANQGVAALVDRIRASKLG
jgi:thiol-disulfide isomerase/thioredoxin